MPSPRRTLLLLVALAALLYWLRPTRLPEGVQRPTSINALKAAATRYLPALRLSDEDVIPRDRRAPRNPTHQEILEPPVRLLPADIDSLRPDGRVVVPAATPGSAREHPIPKLMERARQRWKELRTRQSRTFREAISEYRRRNGRRPPKGFDRWYAFCRANKVVMIDEFDMISKAINPFFALSPSNFRKRVEYVTRWDVVAFGWGFVVKNGRVTTFGGEDFTRAQSTLELMEDFVHELPDFKSWHTAADGPHIWLSGDERKRLEDLAAAGRFDPKEDDDPDYLSKAYTPPIGPMPQTCPLDTPMREPGFDYGVADNTTAMPPLPSGASTTFIGDIHAALDICRNPQFRHTHSAVSWTFPLPGPHLPLFSPGVHGYFADLPAIITEQFDEDDHDDTPWSARTDPRLLWRGQTSGPNWLRVWPWKSSHRARLHLLAQDGENTPPQVHLDAKNGTGVYELALPAHVLNAAYLDVGMVGPAVQCWDDDGTCDEMTRVFKGYLPRVSLEQGKRYKFELDADGNSWSGRFRRLMLSSAVVFKATIYPAWWHGWAIPWLHYVPIQVDYSDLWDALAYFRGGLYGEDAHDEEAEAIAKAGQEFAKAFLRWEDMQAYMFRLFLEYARLYSDERQADGTGADYVGDGEEEPVW